MEVVSLIALSMGAAWASGINLYAAVLTLGLMQNFGVAELPPDMHFLGNPLVIGAAGLMYFVEFFADKIPELDTTWDSIHTFIRIPAGAILASQGMAEMGPEAELIAGLLGGTLATATHATKAGSRVMINTSPEPFSNSIASITEDVAVIGGLWTALSYPWVFVVALALFVLLLVWLLPKLWRGFKRVFAFILRLFGAAPEPVSATPPVPPPTDTHSNVAPPVPPPTGETHSSPPPPPPPNREA